MQCPKCQHPQADSNTLCSACGIVFEKYLQYHPHTDAPSENILDFEIEEIEPIFTRIKHKLLPEHETDESGLMILARLILLIVLSIYTFRLITAGIASNYASNTWLHLVNLPFHEAGHLIFRPFGSFITSLGGTLMQLLMPLICCYVFLFRHINIFGAAITFWWFAENFIDIAPYINDARAGVIPLLGGNTGHSAPYGFHDWEYILTESGLIQYDTVIAQISQTLGSVLMMMALVWGYLLVYRQYRYS